MTWQGADHCPIATKLHRSRPSADAITASVTGPMLRQMANSLSPLRFVIAARAADCVRPICLSTIQRGGRHGYLHVFGSLYATMGTVVHYVLS